MHIFTTDNRQKAWTIEEQNSLFRKKRFTLNEMFQHNTSKATFYVFHIVQLYISTLRMLWFILAETRAFSIVKM